MIRKHKAIGLLQSNQMNSFKNCTETMRNDENLRLCGACDASRWRVLSFLVLETVDKNYETTSNR